MQRGGVQRGVRRGGVRWGLKAGLLGLRHVFDAVNTRVDQLEVLLLEVDTLLLELAILFLRERIRLLHRL